MALLTLGRLELAGQDFPQRQALLLLAFLTIEGRKERAFLAELFWPDARKPLNNLSSALTRLRSVDPEYVMADRYTVEARVPADVGRFVDHAAAGEHAEALDLYHGRFLDGFPLERVGYELEGWILDRRTSLAATARDCARLLAERANDRGRTDRATALAERAVAVGRDAVPDPDALAALHPILRAGNSPMADEVEGEIRDLGHDPGAGSPTLAGGITRPRPSELTASVGGEAGRATVTATRVEQPFFDRVAELAATETGLDRQRAVAIVGLGGIGKSELARQVARRLGPPGSGSGPSPAPTAGGPATPVVWVDASVVTSIGVLPEVISQRLDPEREPAPDLAALGDVVGARDVLIVLDQVDALANQLAPLSDLLGRCPRLRLLVTSRVGVSLDPCATVMLDGLPVRTDGAEPGPAVRLFQAWFRRHAPVGAELAPDDPAVLDICRRLDGHPLAIELAAGWLNVLTPAEIAAGLAARAAGEDGGDELLADGSVDDPGHRGFRSVMASTWDLLDPTCRTALARLSILPGGFDRSVAERVGACDLTTLRQLASWSLVVRRDGRWYSCHPLVQRYSRRRLTDDRPAEAAARRAHADLVLAAVADAPNVDAFDAGTVLDNVEDPVAHVLAVFGDLVELGRYETVAELVDPLDRLLGLHGRHLTLLETLGSTVERLQDTAEPGSDPDAGMAAEAVQDRLEMHLVWLELRLGRYREAAATADRLLAKPAMAADLVIELTRARSAIDRTGGDVDRALTRLLEVRELAETVSPRMRALIDDDIGLCQMILGLYPESRESYRSVLTWARRAGSQPIIARTLLSLGIGHHDSGEILDSLAYLVEAKSVVAVNDLHHIEPFVDVKLARSHLVDGDVDTAAGIIETARARTGSTWEPWLTAEFDLVSARVAEARGDTETMWTHLERSLATSADLDDVPFVAKAFVALVELGHRQPEIGPDAAGGAELAAAVADAQSGADHADRVAAQDLRDRLRPPGDDGDSDDLDGAKPITDLVDEGFAYLRRGRLLTGRRRPS
ncbi:MAG: hypothetical protein AAGA93_10970 [Actinomycetota bacterium]